MSHIFCIIDGMTDQYFEPSQYPTLSSMTFQKNVDTCMGHPAESLGCILRHLGIRQVPEHLRAYAEAMGAGIPVGKKDLVLRGSWFGVDEKGFCTLPVSGPDRLEDDGSFHYFHLDSYKSILIFPELSCEIEKIKTFPPYKCTGKKADSFCPSGCEALKHLFIKNRTEDRCLIPWGESRCAELPPFPEKAAAVCGTTIVRGIAKLLRMDLISVPGATGDTDTDLNAKTAAALEAAEVYPFILLHINGTDEAGHRKSRLEKQTFLRKVDTAVLTPLLSSGHRITVTADHGTDPDTGTHLALPQPVFTAF